MSHRRLLAAALVTSAALGVGYGELNAQTAKPAESAAAKVPEVFRDLEEDPPTELGTELDVNADWSKQPRVTILRERLDPLPFSEPFLSRKGCDFRVMDDWLKMRCPGAAGRVHQLAGDPKDTVVHISHKKHLHPKDGWIDTSRLLFFTRLEPGKAKVFEITSIASGYNSDFESNAGVLSVDWTDTDKGPRVSLSRSNRWW